MNKPEYGNDPHRWRVTISHVDPDAVYRSIRALNGFRSWEDPPRTLYQLATTTLEVVRDTGTWTLLINGASTDCVQDTVARLGYQPDDVKPHPLPELAGLPEQVQRARLRNAGAA